MCSARVSASFMARPLQLAAEGLVQQRFFQLVEGGEFPFNSGLGGRDLFKRFVKEGDDTPLFGEGGEQQLSVL